MQAAAVNPPPAVAPVPQPQNAPPQAAPAAAQPPPRPNPAPPQRLNNNVQLAPLELGMFGRLDSDYHVVDHTININVQDFLPRATWRQLHQMTFVDPPITEDDFVRMWKTLMLKRVTDVYEQEKHQRADQFIRLSRNLTIPAPLADLLYSLGSYFDPIEGVFHHIIPPPAPARPEPWRVVDANILQNWTTYINRMSPAFTMKEFPALSQYEGAPLIHCVIEDGNNLRTIKARYKGPAPADAYVRFLNDELFGDPYQAADCHYTMTEPMNRTAVTYEYMRKYCRAPIPPH